MNTLKWKRLPSDAGVTFEGFKDIRLKKRESVREQLEEFLEYCKDARSPALRVILGEWGEGKTDAYRRYIQPKCKKENNLSLFVSASTLSNSYDLPEVQKLLETTSLPSVRFLVALFVGIRQEEKRKSIPSISEDSDAESYLEKVFRSLIGRSKSKRIFVFIDEFEELLLYTSKLKQIISGIKETLNGQYKNIDEGGVYEGCLHLIIAATPDAYYQLQVREETSLIFGGLGRRAGVIELPEIRKGEGIKFLFSLLEYSYENKLPDPLPFKTLGIFHAIYRITQGNPGNMVSLFTRLLNSAKMKGEKIKVIDFEHFLKFLETQQVFVYGGSSPCLEQNTFFRMLSIVKDQKIKETGAKCEFLLKLLTGELKPFSIDELCLRLNSREKEVKQYINIINTDLKNREKINRTIMKVTPLKESKSLSDVVDAFKEYITTEKERKWIKIDNYSESLEDFEDRITYFYLENGQLTSRIFLPSESASVISFFEGISSERAVEIANIISRRLCEYENYYLVSDEFLSQVYPTPIPRELEFIRDREIRWKLWRELRKNLSEQYIRYMPDAFVYVLKKSGRFDISEIRNILANTSFNEVTLNELTINLCFFAVNGDVKASDIEEISKLLKRTKPPIHCFVLLYTGDITYDANEKIINKELGEKGKNVIINIKIHPTLARRLICIFRASRECKDKIREDMLIPIIRRIVDQEIGFSDMIRNWLSTQEERGVVIKDIDTSSELTVFAGALKFYINFIEKSATSDEIFNKNQTELLDRFVWYGSRIGIIPDIEKPKFNELTKDLQINGFLEKKGRKYSVKRHPVEIRILELLEKEKKLTDKELKSFFISRSERYLKNVFLPILEYKGLIKKDGQYYVLNDLEENLEEVKDLYKDFQRNIKVKKGLSKYGYIFIWKKHKQTRFITLEDFSEYIGALYKEAINYSKEIDKSRALQKLSLLKNLLNHFNKRFLPIFEEATKQAEELIVELKRKKSEFQDSLEKIRDGFAHWLKIKFGIKNILEYKSIEEALEKIEEIDKYGFEEVKENIIDTLKDKDQEKFYFSEDKTKAYYFNPKLYAISSYVKIIDSLIGNNERLVNLIIGKFQDFEERLSVIETEIRTRTIREDLIISKSFLHALKKLIREISPNVKPIEYKALTIRKIKKMIDDMESSLTSTIENMEKCLRKYHIISEKEEKVSSEIQNLEEDVQKAKKVFNTPNFKKWISDVIERKNQFQKRYKDLSIIYIEDVNKLLEDSTKIENELDKLDDDISNLEEELETTRKDYSKNIKEFIADMNKILKLTKKRYKISSKSLEKKLTRLERALNTQQSLKDIEETKKNIHSTFYQKIQQFLTKREVEVLELLMKETERTTWIPKDDITKMVAARFKISLKRADEIIDKLMKEGLLKTGITLAF